MFNVRCRKELRILIVRRLTNEKLLSRLILKKALSVLLGSDGKGGSTNGVWDIGSTFLLRALLG